MKSLYGIWVLFIAGVVGAPFGFGWPFWKFPSLVFGLLFLVLAYMAARTEIRFRRKGWVVWAFSYLGEFEYRERHEGKTRSFKLPGGLIEDGHPVYNRLMDEHWQALAPDWARDRRLEIEARILENPFYRPL